MGGNVKGSNATAVALQASAGGLGPAMNINRSTSVPPSTQLVARMVKVEAVVKNSNMQTRQIVFDPDKYAEDLELLNSIKAEGVIEPIVVRVINKDIMNPEYQLIAGERRLSAATLAGLETVPAIIKNIDVESADLKTIAENSGRRDTDDFESAIIIDKLFSQHPDWSLATIATKTGWSRSKVAKLHQAYKESCPTLKSLMASGVSARKVISLQKAFDVTDPSKHQLLAEKVIGLTEAESSLLSNAIKNNNADPITYIDTTFGNGLVVETIVETNTEPNASPIKVDVNDGDLIVSGNGKYELLDKKTDTLPSISAEKVNTESSGITTPVVYTPNDDLINHINKLTSLDVDVITDLVSQAKDVDCLDNIAFISACLYVAQGGDKDQAIGLMSLAKNNKKAEAIIKKYVFLFLGFDTTYESIKKDDPAIANFVKILIFGAK